MSTYLASFFSLPVNRQSGEHLTHEQTVHKLDAETVSYRIELGVSGLFSQVVCITIKVEVALYEAAIAWLKDLVYGSEFVAERYVFPSVQRP